MRTARLEFCVVAVPLLALLLLVSSSLLAAPQAKRRKSKAPAPSVSELAQALRASRGRPLAERFGAAGRLTRLRTEEARRASLELLETETLPAIRGRLLAHVATLPKQGALMRRELSSSTDFRSLATASSYLLSKSEGGRRTLLAALDRASGPKDRLRQQSILLAFGDSAEARDHKTFLQRSARLTSQAQASLLSRLLRKKGAHYDKLRREALADPYPPLRGAALQQLCAQRDPDAIRLAREIADAKKRDAGIQFSLVLALFEIAEREDLPRLARVLASSATRVSSTVVAPRIEKLAKRPFAQTWAIESGVRSKENASRFFALRILEHLKGSAARDALLELTQSKDPALRRRAIFALARKKDRRVTAVLEKAFAKGGLEQRIDALEGLALLRGGEPAFHKRLLELASSGSVSLRLVALDIGSELGVEQLLELLPSLLSAKDWRLRVGGIQLAREVRAKASIPLLIQLLAKEKGRLAEDCRGALASLTRLYYHQAKDWKRWWKRDGKSFVLPPPEKKKKATASRAGGGGRAAPQGGRTSASFYGIPVISERVVYCVDVSGSMSAIVGTGMTRLKVAQEALLSALKSSPRSSRVNVIFFESRVHVHERESISLKRKSKLREIEKFTRRQTPRGGTNIHGALLEAMKDEGVDTIFLLSDGAPSAGEITNATELVDDIVRRNRSRRIVFHCISIGSDSAMLRRLAEETGGRYSRQ